MTTEIETDQEPGVTHPRETFSLTGHEAAERTLVESFAGARMHHAWMFSGPRGVGKATLAYRFARHVLGAAQCGARPLDVGRDDPIARRIASRSHGDVRILRRGLNERGKPRSEITVDEARAFLSFFSLKPSEGGWRVAIIDAVDDLNRNAANAILKTLEEPPNKTVLILVCHAPGSTLATIRSRCRRLDLRPLEDADVRAAIAAQGDGKIDETAVRFAGGRPGRAIALAAADVDAMYNALTDAFRAAPQEGARAFLKSVYAKAGDRGQRLMMFLSLARDLLRRAAVVGSGAEVNDPRDSPLFIGIAPPAHALRFAEAFEALLELEREAEGLDMDPTHAFSRAARVLERAIA